MALSLTELSEMSDQELLDLDKDTLYRALAEAHESPAIPRNVTIYLNQMLMARLTQFGWPHDGVGSIVNRAIRVMDLLDRRAKQSGRTLEEEVRSLEAEVGQTQTRITPHTSNGPIRYRSPRP